MVRYAYRLKELINRLGSAALLLLVPSMLVSGIMSACASVPPPVPPVPVVTIDIQEATVWVDYMPNVTPRGHAVLTMKLTNTADSAIAVTGIEGFLAPAQGGPAFRRFSIVAEKDGTPITTIELLPGLTYEYRFKSSAGYQPFDTKRYEKVTAGITFTFASVPSITAERSPVAVMITH